MMKRRTSKKFIKQVKTNGFSHAKPKPICLVEQYHKGYLSVMDYIHQNIKAKQTKSLTANDTPLLSDILDKIFQRGSVRLSLEDKHKILEVAKLLFGEAWCHKPLKEAAHSYHPLELFALLELDDLELESMTPKQFHENLKKIFLQADDLHTNYVSLATPFLIYVPIKIEEYWIDQFEQRFLITQTNQKYAKYLGKTVSHWNGIPLRSYLTILGEYTGGSNDEYRVSRALEILTVRNLSTNLIPLEDFVVLTITDDDKREYKEEIQLPWNVFDLQSGTEIPVSTQHDNTSLNIYQQSIALDAYLGIHHVYEKKILNCTLTQGNPTSSSVPQTNGPFIYDIKNIDNSPWGYIKITTFAPEGVPEDYDMPREFINIAEKLKDKVKGLIIDVRDNGGGNVTFAEDIVNYLRPVETEDIQRNKASFRLSSFTKLLVVQNYEQVFSQWKNDIQSSWNYHQRTGDIYSKGFAFQSGRSYPEWWGPSEKILLTNTRCYSATDSFAAAFYDNDCGKIVGQNNSTGAGGANVFTYSIIKQLLNGNSTLPDVDHLVNFRVAIRRTTRRKGNSGLPIEDVGVTPHFIIRPTKNDYFNQDQDFLTRAIDSVLKNRQPHAAFIPSKAIYFGKDTRQDWYQVEDSNVIANAQCVGAIFDISSLQDNGNRTWTLSTGTLGRAYRLQKGEKFWDQPSYDPITQNGANGTVFIVSINNKEYVITAGHCVRDPYSQKELSPEELATKRIVFGYKIDYENFNPLINIPDERVYKIGKIRTSRLEYKSGDWAVLTLDREVDKRYIIPCRELAFEVQPKEKVYVLGHPSGLPLKRATGTIHDTKESYYFRTDLTTFAGNSGSPVFNEKHQIVGILVRGAEDYSVQNDGQYRASVINYWGKDVGEDVSRIGFPLKEAQII